MCCHNAGTTFPPSTGRGHDHGHRHANSHRNGYGQRHERGCAGIDCEAAVDGPYFYARPRTDRIERITTCGGACMGGRCTDCPPRDVGWTCPTY